jgi:hypothetical protein
MNLIPKERGNFLFGENLKLLFTFTVSVDSFFD